MWRQLSMNYVRYSQIAASATRKCLKSSSKNEVDRSGKSTAKVIAWEDGKPMGDNFLNILTDITMNSDFDEETWLLEPPKIPSHSNDVQQSGRIVEWLEGAAMNIDYETRSALSRRLTSLAARKS
ncbi:unnamed protein product [Thelazia callipaeda]|uniref:Uncharacterized protein n=1 Tax=Thelazia callipaeda TaxID=103827 RepID=A0A0N5CNW0_THECL|nr:unnamed protein product [Thelazia callipaeda]